MIRTRCHMLAILLLATPVAMGVLTQAKTTSPDADATLRAFGVEINVDDMDTALAFYTRKLGFETEDRSGYPGFVILQSGDSEKLILNRVRKLRSESPLDTGLSFTLQVNDLDETIARMKTLGVEFAEAQPRKEAVGNAISIKDPFGRRISLMHQTIVKVEPFKEPKLYNFGFNLPDLPAGRDFYANKLGFVVRSERYLPLDLPLGHADKSFAFMLHTRPGIIAIKSDYPNSVAFNTAVFSTPDLAATVSRLQINGVKIVGPVQHNQRGDFVMIEDPFGNVSKLQEIKSSGHVE